MRYECKQCGNNMTGNVIQDMINDIISKGGTYIKSDGSKAKYEKINWKCECGLVIKK